MDEPQEVTDRRWRFNLMGAVENLADAKELIDLHDTELIPWFFDCVSDDFVPYGAAAMTVEERSVVRKLCNEINDLVNEAILQKQKRTGVMRHIAGLRFRGATVSAIPGPEPEDLTALGWFEKVRPLAREAFNTFSVRGWMDEGLWDG